MTYEVWRHDGFSWVSTSMSSRWEWLARFRAWEHTKRGWFVYKAVVQGRSPVEKAVPADG